MDARERQAALGRARQGDNRARSELVESYRPYARVIARAFCDSRGQARIDESDLTQDAFLEAHRGFGDFCRRTVAEFAAWLRQVVLFTAGRTIHGRGASARRPGDHEQAFGWNAFAAVGARSSGSPS